jgi:hypothetical protein
MPNNKKRLDKLILYRNKSWGLKYLLVKMVVVGMRVKGIGLKNQPKKTKKQKNKKIFKTVGNCLINSKVIKLFYCSSKHFKTWP